VEKHGIFLEALPYVALIEALALDAGKNA